MEKEIPRRQFKIGRNERCYCGSGVKYKNCCGKEKVSVLPTDTVLSEENIQNPEIVAKQTVELENAVTEYE